MELIDLYTQKDKEKVKSFISNFQEKNNILFNEFLSAEADRRILMYHFKLTGKEWQKIRTKYIPETTLEKIFSLAK